MDGESVPTNVIAGALASQRKPRLLPRSPPDLPRPPPRHHLSLPETLSRTERVSGARKPGRSGRKAGPFRFLGVLGVPCNWSKSLPPLCLLRPRAMGPVLAARSGHVIVPLLSRG